MARFPKVPGGRAQQKAPSAPVELPPIERLTATVTFPSILLQGKSGTGKTYSIGRLLKAGYKGLILAVEPKMQELAKYEPNAIFIHAPVVDATTAGHRPPTIEEKYDRLMAFADALERGEYREIDGERVDFIAIDGLLEVGDLIYAYWKKKRPTSDSTGKKNTYGMWDEIADRSIDFFKRCQHAAGLMSQTLGLNPVAIICTIGEQMVEAAAGQVRYVPLFPGQKALKNLPYNFGTVLRLESRNNGGRYEYVIHTIGTEEFDAKAPPIFEAEMIDPDFAQMYTTLLNHHQEGGSKD